MRVGIVGAGRIGGNAARLLAAAGHEMRLSFARDRARLAAFAGEIGERAAIGTPAEVVAFGARLSSSRFPGTWYRWRSSKRVI